MDWKHGYFAESGYTYGYYAETTPSRLRWAALLKGAEAPMSGFRYLDLGCGQGLTLLLTAAHHPESEFVGIDFMPEHIAHARGLAQRAGLTNVQFIEGDFLTLSQSPDRLGDFDYVIAHGITTWVAPAVRDALFELAAKVLKPGGLMYNSYNTYPGWLSANPFQHLVIQLQARYNGRQALDIARKGMESLKQAKSGLFKMLPALEPRLDKMANQDPAYLVQEYNNLHWQPVYCSEMLQCARQNKLEFLGSATLPEVFDQCYPPELLALINTETDQVLRETIRDLGVAQGFRRDIYVKGARKYWPLEQRTALMDMEFAQTQLAALPPGDSAFKFSGSVSIEGERAQYLPVLEAFGASGRSLGEVVAQFKDLGTQRVLLMSSLLMHGGWLAPKAPTLPPSSQQLNRALFAAVLAGAPYRFVSLGAVQTAFELGDTAMMLLALVDQLGGEPHGPTIAARLDSVMRSLNRRFGEHGQPIEDAAKSLAKAQQLTEEFLQKTLPLCRSLNVI